MKTNIQKKAVVIVLAFLTMLAVTLSSCQKEQTAQQAQTDQALQRKSVASQAVAETDYVYWVGLEPFIEGPDKTVASNGDIISIEGEGTLSINPKSVTGSGSFEHTNAAGTLLASGTWEALELLSFKSFGNSTDPTLPANFEAGLALIRIHLSPDAGGAGFDAILQISCVLPGAKYPPGFEEGVRVVVQDVINFNKQVHGQTLFIRQ